MITIIFYEKPGCINNTKQKALLQSAGYCVEAHNLLTEPWTAEKLRPFFSDRPVVEWFNPTAPAIKSGDVNPQELDDEVALELMIKDPLLIRRPLMQINDRYQVGFDSAIVQSLININSTQKNLERLERLEICPHSQRLEPHQIHQNKEFTRSSLTSHSLPFFRIL